MSFQTTKTKRPDRVDHVWEHRGQRDYKCVLCGALTDKPPEFADKHWVADRYEPLTDEERAMCPA